MTPAELAEYYEGLAGHVVTFRYKGTARMLLLDPVDPVREGACGDYLIGRELRRGGQFTAGFNDAPCPRSYRLDRVDATE